MRRLRLSPLLAASLALAVAASALGAAPSSAQDGADTEPVLIIDPDATITFTGSGWGHGVGMSQWGAYSRTLAGHSVAEILGFYYEGTELVENYGRSGTAADPEPTPTPTPSPQPTSTPAPTSSEDPAYVLLATAETTTLVPEGLNRITIDNADITHNGQDATRVPPGTPITVTRADNNWHISYNGINICPNGCAGQTAQLHFATNTAVAVSTTGRSYSHGRINLIATDQNPTRFHITIDSLTIEKYLTDPHNDPGSEQEQPEDSIRALLATAETTTLVPEGLNRITIDNTDIAHNGQNATRVPAGTPITVTRADNNWHISYNGINICPNGCAGQTAQLHFATNTAVAVSTTGRSYSHGRINLIATDQNPPDSISPSTPSPSRNTSPTPTTPSPGPPAQTPSTRPSQRSIRCQSQPTPKTPSASFWPPPPAPR